MLVAKLTWRERLRNRRIIHFLDNDAARQVLIKAYSPVLPSLRIVMECLSQDYSAGSVSWYARVPTAANCSDEPSRMMCALATSIFGAKVVRPIGPAGIRWGRVLSMGRSGPTLTSV